MRFVTHAEIPYPDFLFNINEIYRKVSEKKGSENEEKKIRVPFSCINCNFRRHLDSVFIDRIFLNPESLKPFLLLGLIFAVLPPVSPRDLSVLCK
jgi:hypothetical protein